jgi:class 3 adenylate cyclase
LHSIQKRSILLLGDTSRFPFEHRILNATNLLAGILLFVSAFMNAAMGLGPILTVFCFVLSINALVLYYMGRVKGRCADVIPWTIANLILGTVIGFFVNGGSHGGIQYYLFPSIFTSVVLVKPKYRWQVTTIYLLLISLCLLLEHYFPWLINGYPDPIQRLTDIWISILSAAAGISLATGIVFDNFRLFKGLLLAEKRKGELLIRNTMPRKVAQRLLQGEKQISEAHGEVTVLFADIVGFTTAASHLQSQELVSVLDSLFQKFDHATRELGLEKVKTIGDAYMVVGGIPGTRQDHADACVELGVKLIEIARTFQLDQKPIELRVGMDSGPVIAGVIGSTRMHYDLWGNTVNVASRLQSLGDPGTLHLSGTTHALLKGPWNAEPLGPMAIKGLQQLRTYRIPVSGS